MATAKNAKVESSECDIKVAVSISCVYTNCVTLRQGGRKRSLQWNFWNSDLCSLCDNLVFQPCDDQGLRCELGDLGTLREAPRLWRE